MAAPRTGRRKLLGELLIEKGLVSEKQVADALERQKKTGEKIGEALVAMGIVSDQQVVEALGTQLGYKVVDLEVTQIPPAVLELIPASICKKHNVIPIGREDGRITVAMTDPLDFNTMDSLRFILNSEIEPIICSRKGIEEAIDRYFSRSEESVDLLIQEFTDPGVDKVKEEVLAGVSVAGEDADAPIIKLVHLIITEAMKARASDIHIEPLETRLRVRYRIDGVCREIDSPPKRLQGAIISRIKILSGMKVEEKRVPQDGRILMRLAGRDLDLRVSCLPGLHGESTVMRILDRESVMKGLDELGFRDDDYQKFLSIIKRPSGIFLVTGPTGSGKTTTLYSALSELNRSDRKIITVEEPVEYTIPGINQTQVRPDIDLTFASILRAMLRQAPEIILVGETRDTETATTAIEAALTGHLVFTTLHTNDAPSSIARLIDLGIKPFLVASAVQAIMAQRLVRTVCTECKEQYQPEERLLMSAGFSPEEAAKATFFHGRGCESCHHSGYRGRKGIFEIMTMSPVLADMTFHRAPISQIREQAKKEGMRTLREDGLLKAAEGITTVDEVLRVTGVEEVVEQ